MNILLLHPGEMGHSVGSALVTNGHQVYWVNQRRSAETITRADAAGLIGVERLDLALSTTELVVSVCPPEFAVDVASQVMAEGYQGQFLDANAVAPGTMAKMQEVVGNLLVDGGIIGPPAWKKGSTRLYLSGAGASEVAQLFEGSLLEAKVCGGDVGAASALKMSYAGYTKGSSALLLAIRALACAYQVDDSLLAEWEISQPELAKRSERVAAGTAKKAWRFEAEMREIADTFDAANLPSGFHEGAAALYHLMAGFKNQQAVNLDDVLAEILLQRDKTRGP